MSDFISKSRLKWEVEKWYEKEYYSSFNAAVYRALIKIIDKFPSVEQETRSDCISREELKQKFQWLEKATKYGNEDAEQQNFSYSTMMMYEIADMIEDAIDNCPSVEPERKHGKWIKAIDPDVNAWTGGHTCSECGRACVQMSMNYCANCGAPMEVQNGKENS